MHHEEMRERGLQQVQDVVKTFPGVTFGSNPSSPLAYSMRGFTGSQITVLRDGVYLGPSTFIDRPSNTFNLESIEVLKGPASVLYGQGAVGGAINVRTREPTFGPTRVNAQIGAGSFNTVNLGVGGTAQINDQLAARLDVSRNFSDGFVKDARPSSFNATASLLWKPQENFSVKLGMDYLNDQLSSYYGTPLVPAAFALSPMTGLITSKNGLVIDRSLRYKNYNIGDVVQRSNQFLTTAVVNWQPTTNITVRNIGYYFFADRDWKEASTFTYLGPNNGETDAFGNPIPPGSIGRDRFYVFHSQHNYGNILTAAVDHELLGIKNRVLVGADLSSLHFTRHAGFPDAWYADYVNPWNPNPGSFGNFPGLWPMRRTGARVDRYAGLFEDVLELLPHLKLVTGARYEFERLDRVNYNQDGTFNPDTGFRRNFRPFNFRVGAIYDVTRDISLYGQYTTAQDPIGSAYFVVNANQNFNLSRSRQGEVGAKVSFDDGRVETTLALYEIRRSNILSGTTRNTVSNIGSQMSRGVEFSTNVFLTPQWRMNINAAYTFARYGTFIDTATRIDATGNRPPNVPTWTANLWSVYSGVADLPLDLGLNLGYVGDRAGDINNNLFLSGYLVTDIYSTYHLAENLDATFRINNLFDKAYVQWVAEPWPTQPLLGAPRSFSFLVSMKF